MDDGAAQTAHLGSTLLFAALLTGLVAAALLLVLAFQGSSPGPTFVVGNATGFPCPAGEGVPACFRVSVANTGGAAARPRCVVRAAPGTTARFAAGSAVYVSPFALEPGPAIQLEVLVDTEGDIVLPPVVRCGAVV
jgi:hypothetical protein